MGDATSDYFCALGSVSGRFYGESEEVFVTRAPVIGDPGKYRWYLRGTSQQSGVRAQATCARGVAGYTGETKWSQGEPAKDLGPTTDRVCFLSRIRGHFAGEGEKVRVRKWLGRWLLDGTSQQSGVAAGARCVYVSPDFASPSEHSVHNGSSGTASLLIGGNTDGGSDDDFCALTRVQGELNGGTVAVGHGAGPWYVSASGADALGAGARCLFHEFIIR
jgi:hypothetical protein